jgi:hypothetical protein
MPADCRGRARPVRRPDTGGGSCCASFPRSNIASLRLAAQHPTSIHLILNSCPAPPFLECEVFALTSAGPSSAEAAAAGSLLHRLTRSAEAGEGLAAGRQIIASVVNEPWYPKLHAAGFGPCQNGGPRCP